MTEFLLDTGADRTALNARTLHKLDLPVLESEEDISGLGGAASSVVIETKLNLLRDDGTPVVFTSRFTAVTDPTALDLCVPGRDIMELFSVIIDRPGNVVCLLRERHGYSITQE